MVEINQEREESAKSLSETNKNVVSKNEVKDNVFDIAGEKYNLELEKMLRQVFSGREELSENDIGWRAFRCWAMHDGSRLDDLLDQITTRAEGAPLQEASSSAATLVARQMVQNTSFDHKRLAALIEYTLAPTLLQWENERLTTPEEETDFLLGSLGRNAPPRRMNAAVIEFGARLWNRLQHQANRDIDYWKTIRNFGDFFLRIKGRSALLLAAQAYDTLIRSLCNEAWDRETADLLSGTTNNLASLIDDIAGRPGSSKAIRTIFAAGRLHALLVCSTDDFSRLRFAERRSRTLDALGNVPTLFQYPGGPLIRRRYLRQAWFCTRTALARARLRLPGDDDAKDVTRAFFNAGVAINRSGNRREEAEAVARIVVNTLGLWWALHFSGDDTSKALSTYDGSSCATNLMGALTDIHNKDQQLRISLSALWRALHGHRQELGSDFQRIGVSAQEMNLDPNPGSSSVSLKTAVSRFLIDIGYHFDLPSLTCLPAEAGDASNEHQRKLASYLSWRAAATAIRRVSGKQIYTLCYPLWRTINRTPPRPTELPNLIAHEWINLLNNQYPLVAAGLVVPGEIDAIIDAGREAPASLGEWMKNNAWELAGALARKNT